MRKRNRELTCCECGKEFEFHLMKNKFSSKTTCPHCHETLYVENKMLPYAIIAAIIFVAAEYFNALLSKMNITGFFVNAMLFVALMSVCILLIFLLRFLFGPSFMYSVRSAKGLDKEKERVDQMKQDLNEKTSGKKK